MRRFGKQVLENNRGYYKLYILLQLEYFNQYSSIIYHWLFNVESLTKSGENQQIFKNIITKKQILDGAFIFT